MQTSPPSPSDRDDYVAPAYMDLEHQRDCSEWCGSPVLWSSHAHAFVLTHGAQTRLFYKFILQGAAKTILADNSSVLEVKPAYLHAFLLHRGS